MTYGGYGLGPRDPTRRRRLTRRAGADDGAGAGGVRVAHAAASAGFGEGEGRHGEGAPGCTGSSGSTLKPQMAEELSLKATTELLGLTFGGVLTMLNRVSSIWGPTQSGGGRRRERFGGVDVVAGSVPGGKARRVCVD